MQLTPRLYILVLIHWYGNINAETVRESLLVAVIEAINCYRYCIIISLSSDIKKRCHCIRSAWFWIFPGSAKASTCSLYRDPRSTCLWAQMVWRFASRIFASPQFRHVSDVYCVRSPERLFLSSLFLKYTGIEQVLCKWIGEYTDHKWTLRYVGCTTRSVCGGASAVIFITTRTVNNVKRLFSAMTQ